MNPRLGFSAGLAAAAAYGLMSFLVHWNPFRFPVEQLSCVRGLIMMAAVLPFCWPELPRYLGRDSGPLWARSLSGALGLFLYFHTLQGTASANANFLFSSSPLFVSLISRVLLRERLSAVEGWGVGLILLANGLLYLPNRSAMPLWVWQTGLAGALVSSLAFVSLGSAAKRFPSSLIVFGFGFMSVIFSLLAPGGAWKDEGIPGWVFLSGTGLLGLAAQYLTTVSFAHLKNSIATSLGRSCVLFSAVMDFFFGARGPHPLEVLAYLVIIAGVALTQERRKRPGKTTAPLG